MDGVISDTQKLHAQVEAELLGRFGISISPQEITAKYAGVKTSEFIDALLKKQPEPYDLEELLKEKWRGMETLASRSVDQVDGSVELVKKMHDLGLKKAVASASNANYVAQVIKSLDLERYFEFLASGDMVSRGKPDPEIFLLAAAKLGADPAQCLVIEDGVSGMQAAKTAGMKCIGLVASKEKPYPTANLVCSLREITPEYLNSLS